MLIRHAHLPGLRMTDDETGIAATLATWVAEGLEMAGLAVRVLGSVLATFRFILRGIGGQGEGITASR